MFCEIIADSCVLDVAWFIFIRTDSLIRRETIRRKSMLLEMTLMRSNNMFQMISVDKSSLKRKHISMMMILTVIFLSFSQLSLSDMNQVSVIFTSFTQYLTNVFHPPCLCLCSSVTLVSDDKIKKNIQLQLFLNNIVLHSTSTCQNNKKISNNFSEKIQKLQLREMHFN